MQQAVEGMVQEQEQVIIAFIITIVSITISTMSTFFIMFNNVGAIASTILVIVGMLVWLKYTLRIYNRFKFSRENEEMRFSKSTALEYKLKQDLNPIHSEHNKKYNVSKNNTMTESLLPASSASSIAGSLSSDVKPAKTSKWFQSDNKKTDEKKESIQFTGYLTIKSGEYSSSMLEKF